jgi:DNA-binding transcriptional ArsR family regulator
VRPRSREVRIKDPGALRALAHPARLTIVDELYGGGERTASELGELTGLTASAMSYHLRALERWGIVERAGPRQDGRERPWRAAGRSLSLVSDSSALSAAAADVIAGGYLQQLREELRRWSLVEDAESKTWREATGMSRSSLWLTGAEVEAFSAELKALTERYEADRNSVEHPVGTRRVVCLVAIVPVADEQGES